jgi:hypothetical protein
MKTVLIAGLLFSIAPAVFAQDFDFHTLDKLAAVAKSSTNVTLNADMLKLAAGFLGSDNDKDAASIKAMVANLKGIYVREYEFDKPGQYSESDVAALRASLKQPKWSAIVEVKEDKEWTQVFVLPIANSTKLGGLAVVSTEPTSLTVVYIDGSIDPADLEKLSGNMGIPEIKGLDGKLGNSTGDNKAGKKTGK